jgi:hypothetical protein
MHELQDHIRPNSSCSEGWEDRTPAEALERRRYFSELIAKANTVPIQTIFGKYGIRIDPSIQKITCPFKHHQGGHERTPSFYLYPDTNSFWCFGCKTGRAPVDFVSVYDGTSRAAAAAKILRLFESEVSDDWQIASCNSMEKQDETFAFSQRIHKAMIDYPLDIDTIEMVAQAFDTLTEKYELDIAGLKLLSSRLQERLPK